ncbi:60S ribosomal protein L13a-1 [Prunus yedoensis var. nudiflora]|uniref:60S ribosomal protein L13a-1 n=1 Tax=Prunus yedoensis var. nudiflora TaxID=2094558 RepID=A0A314YT09_PRUYE|nr:60S ribosomal protein L13a-1 [Prunus yedoensis var. nudiflora]
MGNWAFEIFNSKIQSPIRAHLKTIRHARYLAETRMQGPGSHNTTPGNPSSESPIIYRDCVVGVVERERERASERASENGVRLRDLREASGGRRTTPHARSSGVGRSQGPPERPANSRRTMRRDRHIGRPRQAEDEVHEVPAKAYEHPALSRPIHFRSPAKIFWRTVRGMIPHKTKRGAEALARLKAYEGIPPPYDKTKRMVVPDALKVLRLQKGHKYCLLGQLSSEVGWNHFDTIKALEEKRKERAQLAYERKKQLTKLRLKAEKSAEEKLGSQLEILASVTY